MDTFEISQTPDAKNIYLYPISSSVTVWTAVGTVESANAIDDVYNVYDTTTYVKTNNVGTVTDLYNFENASATYTGSTINNITIVARAKSINQAQNSSGTFELIWDDGAGNKTYSSNTTYSYDYNITTGYQRYDMLLTSNPAKNTAWTWTDIDNMIVGFHASSPSKVYYNTTDIFRPNADGTKTECTPTSGSDHYKMVDYDGSEDENDTYVYELDANSGRDTYNIPTHDAAYNVGTIHKVTIFNKCMKTEGYGGAMSSCIYVWGNQVNGTEYSLNEDYRWHIYSEEYTSNPTDSTVWEWDDIDNLEIGIYLESGSLHNNEARDCLCYAVVDYDLWINPYIAVTQNYVKVNYTPNSSTVSMIKPESYTFGHSREVKKLNFWNGERSVYDVQRASKTLSMSGREFNHDNSKATDILYDMKDFADNGSEITISGMNDGNLNTTWFIKSFNWNQDENNPNIYNWTMECEKA